MKKSIKKAKRYLSQFVGQQIIRIGPTMVKDPKFYGFRIIPAEDDQRWDFTNIPITLYGFKDDGRIIANWKCSDGLKIIGHELPIEFTDWNWEAYSKVCRGRHNPLNKWKGMCIKRIRPTEAILVKEEKNVDESYMNADCAPILVVASKHHIVVKDATTGKMHVLNSRFSKPEDWTLA